MQSKDKNTRVGARVARCFAAMLAWTAVACGAAEPGEGIETPYAQALFGYMEPDEERGTVEHGEGIALAVGRELGRRLILEIEGSHFTLETDEAVPTDFYRTNLGATVLFPLRRSGWIPFVSAGAGVAYNDVLPDSRDATDAYVHGGLGFMTSALGPYGLRVRVDARYLHDFFEDGTSDVVARIGLVVPLRKPRTIEVVRTETREVIVEKMVPAPAPAQPPAPPAPPPRTVIIELRGVEFESGSAQLTQSSLAVLQKTAASLLEQPSMRVEVAGHTDSVGRDDANLDLSRQRAQSVADYLATAGVERDRLQAAGYGETEPVATNNTLQGRARNRRVELRVLSR